MIKLSFKYEPLTLKSTPSLDLWPARRLVVLVPSSEGELSLVTRRVWELSQATGAQVRYLGLCSDAGQELALRRTLVTASALMSSGNVSADSEIFVGKDWLSAVRSRLQASDMLVCCLASSSLPKPSAMQSILKADLGVPLYIIPGAQPASTRRSAWLPVAAAWIGSLMIIAAFFWLQVKIGQLADEWSMFLQLLAIAAEFSLIWNWNRHLG